jgi:hypothetical protein
MIYIRRPVSNTRLCHGCVCFENGISEPWCSDVNDGSNYDPKVSCFINGIHEYIYVELKELNTNIKVL